MSMGRRTLPPGPAPQISASDSQIAFDTLHPGELKSFESTISDDERRRIRTAVSAFSALSPTRSLIALACDWFVIFAAIAVAVHISSLWATAACVFIVGSRQHALLLLMHDAAHRRLHPNPRCNEWLSDLLCAFPLFVTTAGYRQSHFAHHRHTNTGLDPDWIRRQGQQEWRFPKSRWQLIVMLTKQITGLNAGGMLAKAFRFGVPAARESARVPSGLKSSGPRLLFYACGAALVTYLGIWQEFFLFWILPIGTALAFLMRVRSISEHFGIEHRDELSSSRNVIPAGLERPFLGLHGSHLHLDHHLYPSVPFYNLGHLHEVLLVNEHYRRCAKTTKSYVLRPGSSLWSELVRSHSSG
jgi:fatty acid desaturase